MVTALERLRARIPEAKDELLTALLEDAREYILNITGRLVLPAALVGVQVQLATIYYNRQGIEGEQSHITGGVSRSLYGDEDVPSSLRQQILTWRLLNVAQRARNDDAAAGEG